jgi:hypothetical protein
MKRRALAARVRTSRSDADALKRLDALLADFAPGAAATKLELIDALLSARCNRAPELLMLQRTVCFLRAFPDDSRVLRAARQLARGFGKRVARLPRAERESLDDSGMAGTTTRHVYPYAAAQWFARLQAQTAEIDWKQFESPSALAPLMQPLLDPLEDEHTNFDAAGLRDWVARAKGERELTDLAWIAVQQPAGKAERVRAAHAYAAAEVPLRWQLRDSTAAIVHNVCAQPVQFRAAAALRKASADPRAAMRKPLDAITRLPRRKAARLLDVWRAALWSRTRSVYQIEHANLDELYLCDFGLGLQMAALGVAPDARGALEVGYGYLLLANGMPMGYGGFTALFRQINTGINVFPEFRGGEAAYAFEQALRAMRTLTGCDHAIVNPYQFGAGNDEALASGSFWFYYRLGFRPVLAEVRRMAQRESERLRAQPDYRVPISQLRKLAACDLRLDYGERTDTVFDEAWLPVIGQNVTAVLARETVARRAEALTLVAQRCAAVLGIDLARWPAVARAGFAQFAVLLAQVKDLTAWPAAERQALAQLCRGRWDAMERDFALGMTRQDRLREALARAARQPA